MGVLCNAGLGGWAGSVWCVVMDLLCCFRGFACYECVAVGFSGCLSGLVVWWWVVLLLGFGGFFVVGAGV